MYSVQLSHASGLNTDMANRTHKQISKLISFTKKTMCDVKMCDGDGNLQMFLGLAPGLHIYLFAFLKSENLVLALKPLLNCCYSLCPWQYHVTIVAAHWSNHFFKENFPSSKKRSHIIGLLFPVYRLLLFTNESQPQ